MIQRAQRTGSAIIEHVFQCCGTRYMRNIWPSHTTCPRSIRPVQKRWVSFPLNPCRRRRWKKRRYQLLKVDNQTQCEFHDA